MGKINYIIEIYLLKFFSVGGLKCGSGAFPVQSQFLILKSRYRNFKCNISSFKAMQDWSFDYVGSFNYL
jgi:hypothetical protein